MHQFIQNLFIVMAFIEKSLSHLILYVLGNSFDLQWNIDTRKSALPDKIRYKFNLQDNAKTTIYLPNLGNLIRGIDKKTNKREGFSIFKIMFSSQ